MSIISRITTWVQSQVLTSSALNGEFNNIVNLFNNLDAGTTTWDIISTKNATAVPLIADNGAGSNDVVDFKVNGTTQWSIPSTGVLTSNSKKITGLANGTTATDAAAFGQLKVLQTVTATTTASTGTTSSTYQVTGLTVNITPTSASNRILIIVSGGALRNARPDLTLAALTIAKGGTNLVTATGMAGINPGAGSVAQDSIAAFSYIDSPASTSALTYAVYVKSSDNASTVTFNVQVQTATITVMEIV